MRAQIKISVDSWSPDCIFTVNHRSRSASALRIAFEDAMLTECNFYPILRRSAICLCFQIFLHTLIYLRSVENPDLDSGSPHGSDSVLLYRNPYVNRKRTTQKTFSDYLDAGSSIFLIVEQL